MILTGTDRRAVFAAQWMQIRGSKEGAEGAYTRYVTDANDASDEGNAPLGKQKLFCRTVDADPRNPQYLG